MEFTCLWSKDAQQKKRKRWTDGIARFSPSTGLLSLCDQDDSTKISSMRLKPDEAATVLQEDGDEARVGGVSIQIMASIGQRPQEQPQQQQQQQQQQPLQPRLQHQHGQPSTTKASLPSNENDAAEDQGVPEKTQTAANPRETGTNGTTSPPLGGGNTVPIGTKGGAQRLRLGPAGAGFRRRGLGTGLSPLSANLAGSRAGDTGALMPSSEAAEMPDAAEMPTASVRVGLGGRPSSGLKRRVYKPMVSRPAAVVVAEGASPLPPPPPRGFTNDRELTPPSPPENVVEDTPASGGSSFPSARQTATPAIITASVGSSVGNGIRVGLRGAGGGRGGARRFHAPRQSKEAAPSGTSAGTDTGPRFASGASLVAARSQQGAGRLGGGIGGVPGGRAPAGGGGGGGGSGGASRVAGGALAPRASSASRSADSAMNQEDLVLEWIGGNPPRPLLAGASLARRLHPHQREGLKVLWECLAGRGGYEGRGAILADEMGLGKTATAIALCTCVLRHRKAECRKAVVVCPSSLVKNWANEFRKWCPLGGGAVAVDQAGAAAAQLVADFKIGAPARYPILIISYELYRNHGKVVNATEGLGLLIADEGHRLKNSSETKTTKALKACPAVMRLVLTGTPMQNDLDEFFAVADFANPGLLGTLKGFRSRYTRPIKAAWDRKASSDVADLSAERTRELGEITGKFVVRRTKDVIRGSLPPALEVVIFCRPSPQQLSLYDACVAASGARALLVDVLDEELDSDDGGQEEEVGTTRHLSGGLRGVLPLISSLRRLCNHPDLVAGRDYQDGGDSVGGGDGGGGDDGGSCDRVADTCGGNLREKLDDDDGENSGDNSDDLRSDDEEAVQNSRPLSAKNEETNVGVAAAAAATERAVASHANGKGNGLADSGGRAPARAWKVPRGSGAAKAKAPVVTRVATAGKTTKLATASAELPKYETEASGKVVVLEALLRTVRQAYPGDKVVITSNFTSALDVLGRLAERNGWGFLRLDGGTPSNLRQSLVDRFNKAPPENLFLFFLSARAGGVGLNLVGANRIVLFDSDWNPATDEQAMARVWRLGQTKEVSMYRLLCTGTLEESIFQRQIFKGALYDLIHDSNDPCLPSGGVGGTPCGTDGGDGGGKPGGRKARRPSGGSGGGGRGGADKGAAADSRGFSQEELKELFVLKKTTKSDTYDKLKRRRATSTTTMTTVASPRGSSSSSSRRYQDSPLIRRDGSTNSGDGGSLPAGPTSPTGSGDDVREVDETETAADPTSVDERWKAYEGPSDVSDKALRWALEESCAATEGDGDGTGNASAAAGSVVTFVREVLRGGGPAPPPRENSAGRGPVAAQNSRGRSDDEDCEGVGGENTPPA